MLKSVGLQSKTVLTVGGRNTKLSFHFSHYFLVPTDLFFFFFLKFIWLC